MQEGSKTEAEDRVSKDLLMDIIRAGAQQLIAQALKVEVTELLATYADQRDEQGHARVVLSGHHPERDIQTGMGPVTVRVPKVRSRQGDPVRLCKLPHIEDSQFVELSGKMPQEVLMKRTRFSESQIVAILKQADAGIKIKDLCRQHGISDATYYNWKAKYGGLEASDLKRLKEMEGELSKLKRMYADLALENRALKDLIEKKL